jgi:Sec-independent protein translocase protein TatA
MDHWHFTNMSIWHWLLFLAVALLMFHGGSHFRRD